MSIETSPNLYDPEEMASYGFDPNSETDREEWLKTTPPMGVPKITDYSQDLEAYGGPMQQSVTIED